MELNSIMLNEISQKRETNTIQSLLHVESKNKNKDKVIDIKNRLVVARGGR